MAVTEADVRTYQTDGVVCLRGAIATEWIEHLRLAVDEAMTNPSTLATDYVRPGEGRFFGDYNMWTRLAGFRDFEFKSNVAEVAAALMRTSRVQLYNEHLLVKEPGSRGAETPWHQDAPYAKVKGDQFGSLWIAIDSATMETGVMQFAAGSHRWGEDYGTPGFAQGAGESELLDRIEEAIERRRPSLISYDLEPGDCTFHHCSTLHRAGGNRSAGVRRRGLSLRLVGDDVRWAGAGRDSTANYVQLNADVTLPPGSLLPEESFPVVWPAQGSRRTS